jgi:hypothetical protein
MRIVARIRRSRRHPEFPLSGFPPSGNVFPEVISLALFTPAV